MTRTVNDEWVKLHSCRFDSSGTNRQAERRIRAQACIGDGCNPLKIKVSTFGDKEGRRRIRFKFANGAFYVRLTLLPETIPCRKRVNSAWTHCQKGKAHCQETAPHGADHFETEGGRG